MIALRVAAGERRRACAILLFAFTGYAVLTVLITFPLILHLSSRIPKDLEDSLWYVAILWWNAHVLPLTEQWWNGFAFYPATGMMAFSDHLLGASLIASPLQWLGCSPITAYNLTFLVSFPLCAIAAHALSWTLTSRHDAAIVCGLAYGFNPYRVAHLEHLELLMAFGMPVALAALHRYAATRRIRWLVVFAAALTLQALSASYYALFFTVLLGMWVLWFMRPRAWRDALAVAAAGAVSVLALLPIVFGYARIHERHNLTRDFAEVLTSSADVTSFVTASAVSALWGWTAPLNSGERQLFPGLTIMALAIAGAIVSHRRSAQRDVLAIVSAACWVLSICLAAIAAAAHVAGPWLFDWGLLRLSISVPYKPLSLSVAFATGAIALSPAVRDAFRRRSALAFYLIAASVLFLCSLGPKPAFLGAQILYEPPYAWLMRLPLFADGGASVPSVRVPARFAMVAVLALSVAGSLAFARLTSSKRRRIALLLAVSAGIIADGWIGGLPLRSPLSGFRISPDDRSAAVMVLPLGETGVDTAAMYAAALNGVHTVNGYHSYAPLSYHVLKLALEDRDHTVFDALALFGPLVIAAQDNVASKQSWASFASGHPDIARMRDDRTWTLFRLPWRQPRKHHCASDPVPIAAVFDKRGEVDLAMLTDQSPVTRWITSHSQRVGDALVLDLGRAVRLCEVVVSMGAEAGFYPRTLRLATSVDRGTWKTRFLGKMGGSAFLAALDNPRDARMSIPLPGTAARFITLRLEESQRDYPWAVADVVVREAAVTSGPIEGVAHGKSVKPSRMP